MTENNLVMLTEITEKEGHLYREDKPVKVLPRGLAHIVFIDNNKDNPKNQTDFKSEVSQIKINYGYEDADAYYCGYVYEASPKKNPDKKCAIPVQFYKIIREER